MGNYGQYMFGGFIFCASLILLVCAIFIAMYIYDELKEHVRRCRVNRHRARIERERVEAKVRATRRDKIDREANWLFDAKTDEEFDRRWDEIINGLQSDRS